MPIMREIESELTELREKQLVRTLREVSSPQGRAVTLDGQEVLNFSSNDYLGLANDSRLTTCMAEHCATVGVGAGASRLIVGTHKTHIQLERRLAEYHQSPDAVLFNTGYHANIGVLQAIASREDAIFSDQLNHASLIDGCRLSRASVHVYPHKDLTALSRLLSTYRHRARRGIIVSDSVFSMDGDQCDVDELVRLADVFDCLVVLDEAHANGVMGPNGAGIAQMAATERTIRVATLGKALGAFGGYALVYPIIGKLLRNKARSFVYTTAMPPALAAAATAALRIVAGSEGKGLRERLQHNIRAFYTGVRRLKLDTGLRPDSGTSPIIPIIIGSPQKTMEISAGLLDAGVYAQGIRPPTVPQGTSRLRFALSAAHTLDDVHTALESLRTVLA